MTEEEWLATTDWRTMLESLAGTDFTRRLRLFLVGGCRLLVTNATSPLTLQSLALLDSYADGESLLDALQQANALTHEAIYETLAADIIDIVTNRASSNFNGAGGSPPIVADGAEGLSVCGIDVPCLLRDIFGNPFRPVTFPAEWRSEAAVGIAAKMYDSREFGNMPVLADALQDAGCEHADVLAHCREPGTHVRGCWVIDLVLGKS